MVTGTSPDSKPNASVGTHIDSGAESGLEPSSIIDHGELEVGDLSLNRDLTIDWAIA